MPRHGRGPSRERRRPDHVTKLVQTPADWPRILLARAGPSDDGPEPDPTDLDAAVAAGAFAGLKRVVHDLGPTGTIATLAASGLRGRGGGGYPTGEKWRLAAAQPANRRFVVANGYGADPALVHRHDAHGA